VTLLLLLRRLRVIFRFLLGATWLILANSYRLEGSRTHPASAKRHDFLLTHGAARGVRLIFLLLLSSGLIVLDRGLLFRLSFRRRRCNWSLSNAWSAALTLLLSRRCGAPRISLFLLLLFLLKTFDLSHVLCDFLLSSLGLTRASRLLLPVVIILDMAVLLKLGRFVLVSLLVPWRFVRVCLLALRRW
jgi:hypothetical protein